MKKGNIYSDLMQDKYGEYYIGYTNNTNLEFYIDAENFEEVKKYTWYSFVRNNMIGIRARINGEKILLHQFLGFKNYDHIDRNELNNRKYNLRKCTHQENCMNRGKYSNNTSGITGVYFIKSNCKWHASIQVDGHSTNLRYYENKEDAIIARLSAEAKYYKEFAPQKHLFAQYGIKPLISENKSKNIIDMTGWIMSEHGVPKSRLIVIKRVEDIIRKNGRRDAQWLCKCSCGSEKEMILTANHIRTGHTLSCGCLKKESTIESNKNCKKKYNEYDLTGEFGVGWSSNTFEKFYFDLEDYDKIKDYCWCVAERHNYKTLEAKRLDGSNKNIKMSHLLGFENYDHIDRNPLNNRKENLRAATTAENSRNRNISKNNTSGIIGVGLNKKNGKWRARITFEWNEIFLGEYIKKEDAIITRLKAEKKYFGEFAPQQYLYKEYNIE